MSYLFFIFAPTTNFRVKEIAKVLKVDEQDKFDESSIIIIEQDQDYKIYLGYFKKKFENLAVQTKFLVKIKNETFESKNKFYIPQYKSIFLNYIEFDDYYHWYDRACKIFSSENKIPPKCHKNLH